MISRRVGESGGGVLSFTFLDVLTCTMGSLVLLVVILGQKAKNTRLEDALRNGPRKAPQSDLAPPLAAGAQLSRADAKHAAAQLAALRQQHSKLEKLRAKAAERLGEEQSRASHLEEHERRLEHELARLHITLERLEAAEQKQTVDQDTAERELERLRQIVKDTEEQLKKLRTEPGGKKSYAIVPYKGASGTYRRPIYIECTHDAVTIQPEGIRLTNVDFDGPIRSGNPLAAAIRAAREELNARTTAAGAAELPDPYPLLIVRPDGAKAYAAALSAIGSWDADYGYEFVAADWKLEYPDIDPRLSQAMVHAVDQARQRQAMLAKVAPRRYGSRLTSAGSGPGGDGARGGEGNSGFDAIPDGGPGDRIGQRTSEGLLGSTASNSATAGGDGGSTPGAAAESATRYGQVTVGGGGAGSNSGNFADQFTPPYGQAPSGDGTVLENAGGSATNASGAGIAGQSAAAGLGGAAESGTAAEGDAKATSGPGGPAAAGAVSGRAMATAGAAASTAGSASGGSSSAEAGAVNAMNIAAAAGANAAGDAPTNSAAETRGANWANAAASRRASPITRPIQVVVRPDRLDVLPDAAGDAATSASAVVSFHQPTDKMLDELAAVVQQQIRDWGLAGQGMYWRPTLVLRVAPGADRHAIRLIDLLRDSGVDVRFQQVAARPETEAAHGAR